VHSKTSIHVSNLKAKEFQTRST